MKKLAVGLGILGIGVLTLGAAETVSPIRFVIGAYGGISHVLSYQGLGAGAEIGVQINGTFGLMAEGAIGTTTLNYYESSIYEVYRNTHTLSSTPLALFVHVSAPTGGSFKPYLGVGVVYSRVKMVYDYSYSSSYGYSSESSSTPIKSHAYGPALKLGLAVAVSKNLYAVGEYRQIFGKAKYESSNSSSSKSSEDFIGGSDMKFGLRLVL